MNSDVSRDCTLPSELPRVRNAWTLWLGKTFLSVLGWNIIGNFPARKKMVVAVAPHTSNWDFFIGLAAVFALQLKVAFLGKHTLFFFPVKQFLTWVGGIPVNRSRPHGVVMQVAEKIKTTEKILLCLAPEGTRRKIDNWRTGFLQIAKTSDVPVLLVALDYQKKQIQIGPVLDIKEDVRSELKRVYAYYASVTAKYPEQKGMPSENVTSGERN